jgi:WD40 repeat protein
MKRKPFLLRALVLTLSTSLLLVSVSSGASRKLSGEMPVFGSVRSFRVSQDGLYVVYTADQRANEAVELYSAPVLGGAPQRLSGEINAPEGVISFQISADSRFVVYEKETAAPGGTQLFGVPLQGPESARISLTEEIPAGKKIKNYSISSDGEWAVILADLEEAGKNELYSIPILGPLQALRKLSVPQDTAGKSIVEFNITPDGSQVFYKADGFGYSIYGKVLYSVPIEGPAESSVRMTPSANQNGGVGMFTISPNSQRVVYLFGENESFIQKLFSEPSSGSAEDAVEISLPLEIIHERSDSVVDMQISPDSQKVVYILRKLRDDGWFNYDLYSVSINGPNASSIRLSGPAYVKSGVYYFSISPDNQQVVYALNPVNYMLAPDLYRVPISGPWEQSEKLNPISHPQGWVEGFKISPDSQHLVYKSIEIIYTSEEPWRDTELYRVPLYGPISETVVLAADFPAGAEIKDYQFSSDSSRLIYLADQEQRGVFELYSLPSVGLASGAVKLNAPLPEGAGVKGFKVLPQYNWVVYRADQEVAGSEELFMMDTGEALVSFEEEEIRVSIFSDTLELALILTCPTVNPVSVELGTSDPGSAPLTVAFQPGETRKTVQLPLRDIRDGLVVTLKGVDGAGLGIYPSITVRLIGTQLYLPIMSRTAGQ